MTLLEKN